MPWNTPVTPTPGQVITTAWAQGTIIDNLAHLRVLTGNTDPPGTGWTLRSTSSTGVAWFNYDADLATKMNLAAAATATIGAGIQPGFYTSDSPSDGPLGAGVGFWNYITARHTGGSLFQIAGSVANNANIPDLYYRLVTAGTPSAWAKIWHSANDGPSSGLDADKLDGVEGSGYATAANGVPSGLIGAFQNAASIAAGWARFTSGDGRFLVGAGTTFSQTFVEGASAGSSWAHLHALSMGAVASGGGATAATGSNTSDTTWIPPSFTVVWAKKA